MKFEIHKSSAAEPYRFNIVSSNGQVLATSENYASKSSAQNACESIQRGAADADIQDPTDE